MIYSTLSQYPITSSLAVACLVAYPFLEKGSLSYYTVVNKKQYYRLLTAHIVHVNKTHLFMNLSCLDYLKDLEKVFSPKTCGIFLVGTGLLSSLIKLPLLKDKDMACGGLSVLQCGATSVFGFVYPEKYTQYLGLVEPVLDTIYLYWLLYKNKKDEALNWTYSSMFHAIGSTLGALAYAGCKYLGYTNIATSVKTALVVAAGSTALGIHAYFYINYLHRRLNIENIAQMKIVEAAKNYREEHDKEPEIDNSETAQKGANSLREVFKKIENKQEQQQEQHNGSTPTPHNSIP